MDSLSSLKTHDCRVCGRSFRKKFNMKRHMNTRHAGEKSSNESDESSSDMEVNATDPVLRAVLANKNLKIETESDSDDGSGVTEVSDEKEHSETEEEDGDDAKDSEVDLEDNLVFQDWLDQAMEATADMREEQYEKYVNEGMSEEEAKEKAQDKVMWTVQKNFFDQYATFLWHTIHLEDDETHQGILVEVNEKLEKKDGLSVRKAIKKVLGKHKSEFDELFLYESEDEDEDEDGTEEEEMEGDDA